MKSLDPDVEAKPSSFKSSPGRQMVDGILGRLIARRASGNHVRPSTTIAFTLGIGTITKAEPWRFHYEGAWVRARGRLLGDVRVLPGV
jgi:hypothetical protein